MLTNAVQSTQFRAGLAATDEGVADNRAPLLLLHGLANDRRIWRPAIEELHAVDPGRRVLSLDLPGHGESPSLRAYDLEDIVGAVRAAVIAAKLDAPVIVGHSIGGFIATVYAGRYPSRGVVNVDQPLQVGPFIQFLRSQEDALRGPGIRAVWDAIAAGFHTEWLAPAAQELVSATSVPRPEVLRGYWRELLELPLAELERLSAAMLASARNAGQPYVAIAGADVEPAYRDWFRVALPQAVLVVWPRSGHFPHLAYPERFGRLLAATATWPGASARLAL